MTSTAGYGTYPELGSPVWSMVDPTGSALTTATDREAPGAGFLPRTKRRPLAGVGSEIAAAYCGAAQGPIGAVCGGSCTDVWGKATSTSYDQAGRVTQATNPGGTVGYGYTADGLVDTVSLNGGVLADPMYNGWGRMTGVLYPSGGTNKGNATSGSFTIDPVWFRPNGVTWSGPGGAIAANAHTTRLEGNVVDETIDGVDAYPGGELRVRQRGPSCWGSGVGTHGWGCGVAERLLRLPGDNRHVWGVAEWFGWGGGGAELEPGSHNRDVGVVWS